MKTVTALNTPQYHLHLVPGRNHYDIQLLEQELFNLCVGEQDKAAVSLFLEPVQTIGSPQPH